MRRRTFIGTIGAAVAAFFVPRSTVAAVDEGVRMGFVESVRFIETEKMPPFEPFDGKAFVRHIEKTIIPDVHECEEYVEREL